jgi:hypothetical protein
MEKYNNSDLHKSILNKTPDVVVIKECSAWIFTAVFCGYVILGCKTIDHFIEIQRDLWEMWWIIGGSLI